MHQWLLSNLGYRPCLVAGAVIFLLTIFPRGKNDKVAPVQQCLFDDLQWLKVDCIVSDFFTESILTGIGF